MNFIILTNGNNFCTKLLKNFKNLNKLKDVKIYVEIPLSLSSYKLKDEKYNLLLIIKLYYRLISRIMFLIKFINENKSFWRQFQFIGSINNKKTSQFLKSQKIDVIFLAGMSILKKDILSSTKFGIYNCHPALIPNVRGLDVVYHSITNLIPPIISIHRVDEGIDTGKLIQAHKVHFELLEETTSYDEINESILNFAAFKFYDFIIFFISNFEEKHIDMPSMDLPILPYCKNVENKDYDLFFKCLKYIYKID